MHGCTCTLTAVVGKEVLEYLHKDSCYLSILLCGRWPIQYIYYDIQQYQQLLHDTLQIQSNWLSFYRGINLLYLANANLSKTVKPLGQPSLPVHDGYSSRNWVTLQKIYYYNNMDGAWVQLLWWAYSYCMHELLLCQIYTGYWHSYMYCSDGDHEGPINKLILRSLWIEIIINFFWTHNII